MESSAQLEELSLNGTMDSFYTVTGGKIEDMGTNAR